MSETKQQRMKLTVYSQNDAGGRAMMKAVAVVGEAAVAIIEVTAANGGLGRLALHQLANEWAARDGGVLVPGN